MTRERSPTSFDEVAELYDRVRPTYPPELFDDLIKLAGLRPGSALLEIGCGTGQATVPLLDRGLEVTCVEPGARLAELARRNLAEFRDAEVIVARFEEWDGAGRRFDAVTAFTAFHWLDAASKYERAARLLRDDGSLAVVTTSHVFLDDMDAALGELQQEYAAIGWGDGSFRPPRPGELPGFREEIESSGYFRDVSIRRYLMRVRYSSEEFVSVLGTYSDHLALDPETRERLFSGLRRRIDRLGGTFAKDYEFTLHVARRR